MEAFCGCRNLASMTIPKSLTWISANAFKGCNRLAEVHYGGDMDQWRAIRAFDGCEPLFKADVHCHGPASWPVIGTLKFRPIPRP